MNILYEDYEYTYGYKYNLVIAINILSEGYEYTQWGYEYTQWWLQIYLERATNILSEGYENT